MRILLVLLVLLSSACRTVSPLGARIDETLTRMVPFGLSGTVLVADRDGVVLSKGYGRGLAPNTIYDMGSITKSFTATAILMLEEEGKLSLDDTLTKHFENVPEDKAAITLRQIFSHSAGLVDLTGDDYDKVSREQLVADVMRAPLVSKPGEEWHYSNAGYSLLAAIVEKVSGKPYETFMKERLFDPAGMRDTGYRVRDASRAAHTLTPPVDHGSPVDRLERSGGVHWVLLGNGGMLTTTEDLYRWELALRGGKIVSPKVVEKLQTPIFKRSDTMHHAAAWTIETVDGERVMHHGSDGPQLGVNGEFRRYPDAGVAVIFLGNTRVNGWSPRRVVGPAVRKMMRGESRNAPKTAPSRNLEPYAGTYTFADGTIDIRANGDHLVAGLTGQSAIDLFTLQRSEQSLANRRVRNDRALQVAREFAWPKPLRDVTVLGTSRRDRGVFMSTIRARFDDGERLYRFTWAGDKPVLENDDAALPHVDFFSESPIRYALERPLWRESGDTFVFYDIYTNQTIRVTFTGDAMKVGELTIPRTARAASARGE